MNTKTKRDIFFEKTLKLIFEKGYKATTMRDIANTMNFEVANIYNYISSKEALLEGYIFTELEEFTNYIENILESTFTPMEKLKMVISKQVQYTVLNPYKVSLFVNEWRHLSEPKLNKFIKVRTDYMNKVKGLVEEGIKQGNLRDMDAEFATFMIFSSMRWLFTLVAEDKNLNPIQLEKQLNDFIFLGIENNKPIT